MNWDVQRKVWDHLFGKEMFKVDFADTSVIITEPYFNFSSIQESMNEILFEEYQFQSVLRTNGEVKGRPACSVCWACLTPPPLCSCSRRPQRSSLLPRRLVSALLPGGGQRLLLHTHRSILPQQEDEGGRPQVRAASLASSLLSP